LIFGLVPDLGFWDSGKTENQALQYFFGSGLSGLERIK
jgi:hypothetical protein